MTQTNTPAGTAATPAAAPAEGTETAEAPARETAQETRPKPSAAVLKEARKLGKVIVHPTRADVEDNPNARGYDENGRQRPADARAVYLVVPKDVDPQPDPTPEDRGAHMRKVRTAAAKARRDAEKAAEKASEKASEKAAEKAKG